MLPKKYRLPPKDFKTIYSKGVKFRGRVGMLTAYPSVLGPRIGFVINKKIGNAIQRHRMTRLLRVAILELLKEVGNQELKYDLEYVAFEFCNSKEEIKAELENQLRQILAR